MKRSKTGGRQKRTPNRTTRVFREAILDAFEGLGGTEALITWGAENRSEFYKIMARLIPHEVIGPGDNGEHRIKTIVHEHVTMPEMPS